MAMADRVAKDNAAGDGNVDSAGEDITIAAQHERVLIYRVHKEKEGTLSNFCKQQVHDFLRTKTKAERADFWTVDIGKDVLLLVCLISVYDASWNGISNVTNYLYTDKEVKIGAHPDWIFIKK
jgi:hypothetical protein